MSIFETRKKVFVEKLFAACKFPLKTQYMAEND